MKKKKDVNFKIKNQIATIAIQVMNKRILNIVNINFLIRSYSN